MCRSQSAIIASILHGTITPTFSFSPSKVVPFCSARCPQMIHYTERGCFCLTHSYWNAAADSKSASAGNRTRVTSMATMYSTTRPLMLVIQFDGSCMVDNQHKICRSCASMAFFCDCSARKTNAQNKNVVWDVFCCMVNL